MENNNTNLQTNNGTAVATQAPSIKGLLANESIKKRFEEILGAKAPAFVSSILNIVNGSTNLSNADPQSVIMSAAVAATLDLPINPNLGFAYIIPYKTTYTDDTNGQRKEKYVAQFQMGYKGFIQLAMRTGQYKRINATEVRAGQLLKSNPLTEEYEFDFSNETGEVIGYVAYFQMLNGFEKTVYWNTGRVLAHAKKYSKSFNDPGGPWKNNMSEMAFKTLLKYMLSKYGILSIEMQKAVRVDQAVIKDDKAEEIEYVDGTSVDVTSQKSLKESSSDSTEATSNINIPNSNDL